jgi:hypothetical protein
VDAEEKGISAPKGRRSTAERGAKSEPPMTPKEAAKLKILDPACGSGSFLLGAYQYLLDWHLNWYIADGPEKWSQGKHATLRPADPAALRVAATPSPFKAADSPWRGEGRDEGPRSPSPFKGEGRGEGEVLVGHWALTTHERKRILLDHIHGVDIDYQAVEVTKLSLLLRCLEGETAASLKSQLVLFHERALPDLGRNIQCGNSLIGTDIMITDAWRHMTDDERRRINPFDYERAFPQVFQNPGRKAAAQSRGGFDVVIGNPPYIRIQTLMETSPEQVALLRERYASASAGNYDVRCIRRARTLAAWPRWAAWYDPSC